jgi:hypothetical protein
MRIPPSLDWCGAFAPIQAPAFPSVRRYSDIGLLEKEDLFERDVKGARNAKRQFQ